jgi:hypothetical protein
VPVKVVCVTDPAVLSNVKVLLLPQMEKLPDSVATGGLVTTIVFGLVETVPQLVVVMSSCIV